MKRHIDQALGVGSAVAVAVVSSILMVSVKPASGYTGGPGGSGLAIPAAGEDETPAPATGDSPSATPTTQIPASGGGTTGSGGGGGNGGQKAKFPAAPAAPKDTGGFRSFNRLTNRGIFYLNGDNTLISEQAKITLAPLFTVDATTTTKVTKSKKTKTTSVVHTIVTGHDEKTSSDGGKTWKHHMLTDLEYTVLYRATYPKTVTQVGRAIPGTKTKPGLIVGDFKLKPGALGWRTTAEAFTVGSLFPLLPKAVGTALTKQVPTLLQMEGLSGYVVADKWDRPWVVGVSDIALPLAMASIGVMYWGYQA